jgi:hypothetical protein
MNKLLALTAILGFGLNTLAYAANTSPVPAGISVAGTPLTTPTVSAKKPRYKNGHHPKGRRAIARKPMNHIAPVMVSPTAN